MTAYTCLTLIPLFQYLVEISIISEAFSAYFQIENLGLYLYPKTNMLCKQIC